LKTTRRPPGFVTLAIAAPSAMTVIASQRCPLTISVVPARWLQTLATAASLSCTSLDQAQNGAARLMASARASVSPRRDLVYFMAPEQIWLCHFA
jgi:hypothetical protein